jgi:hypothetical protein
LAFSAMSMNSSNVQASSLAPPRRRFRSWSSFRWTLDCFVRGVGADERRREDGVG